MLSTPLSASLVAARYAKAAARPRCAIVRDKEIGIGAFECDHLERRIGLDLSHEIAKRNFVARVLSFDRQALHTAKSIMRTSEEKADLARAVLDAVGGPMAAHAGPDPS